MLFYCGDQTELVENEDSDSSQLDEDSDLAGQYDYLLGMTMWTLTKEKKDELLNKRDSKLLELKTLQGKTPSAMWKEDLDTFLQEVCCEKRIWWLHVGICHVKTTSLSVVT
jgi:DNA gyrase/topoisomerase IV, subunit A.